MDKMIFDYIGKNSERFSCQLPLSKSGVALTEYLGCEVGCDWLQVYCIGIWESRNGYNIKILDYSTRHFKYVAEIYRRGELLGSVAFCPFSSIINPMGALLKLDNQVLYRYDCFKLLDEIVLGFGIQVVNITRIDLFRDFNLFKYGLEPSSVIRRYCNGEYLKAGSCNFKIQGECSYLPDFQYLRFGSNSSDFSVYLYNKSKELEQRSMKPYILERAKMLGVDVAKPVWRLEISLKSSSIKQLEKSSGDLINCDLDYFKNVVNMRQFYYIAVEKYFKFYHNDGNKRKDRNRGLVLFDLHDKDLKILKIAKSRKSTRSDKIFIRHLEAYNNEMRGISFDMSLKRDAVLQEYIDNCKLHTYYENHVKGLRKKSLKLE